jgi:heme oxygenase
MDAAVMGIGCDVDALAALRGATRALHERLDRHLPLAGPGANLDDYRHHLAASAAWVGGLQPWLERAGEGAAASRRLDWIARDLADCGASTLPAGSAGRVRAADDGSVAFCFGILYVVEGAALGGLELHRRLRARLAPHPLRYLAGAGEATAARWRAVMQALREHLGSTAAHAAACGGAVAAFEEFAALVARKDRG